MAQPVLINAGNHGVAVFGHDLVSIKDLEVINKFANLPDFNSGDKPWLHSVVIRAESMVSMVEAAEPGKPGFVYASTAFDMKSVMINLFDIASAAVEDAKASGYSIIGHERTILYDSLLHEFHHLWEYAKDGGVVKALDNDKFAEKFEKSAAEFSRRRLYELVKDYDLEPAPLAECPYLNGFLAEHLVKQEQAGKKATAREKKQWSFVDQQLELIGAGLYVWQKEDNDHKELRVESFKSLLHLSSKDDWDSAEWKKHSTPLPNLDETLRAQGLVKQLPEANPASGSANAMVGENGILEDTSGLPWDEEEPTPVGVWEPNYSDPVQNPATTQFATQPANNGFATGPAMQPEYQAPAPQFGFQPQFQPQPQYQAPAPQPQTWQQPAQPQWAQPAQPQTQAPAQAPVQKKVPPNTKVKVQDMPEDARRTIGVYYDVYKLMFSDCQPVDMSGLDPMANHTAFANVQAVNTPIMLGQREQQLIPAYDKQFRGSEASTVGGLCGYVASKSNLPCFIIHRIAPDGTVQRRLLMPQNPNKRKADGTLTDQAKEARNRNCIMYIKDANTGDWLLKIVNGVLLTC